MSDCEVKNGDQPNVSTYRLCKRGWVEDHATPASGRITRRIGQMANLGMEGSEKNQVACYGLGGEYKVHYDYLFGWGMNNRLSTVMLYLNDVARGGYTVFPRLEVAVAPVKGAAIMWFNVLQTGENDRSMLHAGCPILLGSKWVLNKWIHERGEYFLTQCPTDKNFRRDYFYL